MKQKAAEPELRMSSSAAQQIRQHARLSDQAEVCGVLIGCEQDGATLVSATIPGAGAVQGGTHVTFTQDTWEHIYRIKDRDYPEARIVGWYHSHPGFGVFLSDHDSFIHKNFFSSEQQVAWVFDPHSDEEGCFGWQQGRLQRLGRIVFVDEKGGEGAGETGRDEPVFGEPLVVDAKEVEQKSDRMHALLHATLHISVTLFLYLIFFVTGFFASWYFYPRVIAVPVDVNTMRMLDLPEQKGAQSATPPANQPAQPVKGRP